MKFDVIKLDGGKAGSVELSDDLFGLEPRADILHRVVRWQRNNAQAGHTQGKDTLGSELLHQEDLSPKRHRWRTPRCTFVRRSSAGVVFTKAQSSRTTATT